MSLENQIQLLREAIENLTKVIQDAEVRMIYGTDDPVMADERGFVWPYTTVEEASSEFLQEKVDEKEGSNKEEADQTPHEKDSPSTEGQARGVNTRTLELMALAKQMGLEIMPGIYWLEQNGAYVFDAQVLAEYDRQHPAGPNTYSE